MFTLIKILFILAAVLAIAGFTTSTFGLVRSFMLDRFNRFVYLGLSAIGIGVLIAGLASGISYLQVRAVINDAFSGEDQAQSEIVEDETVYDEPESVENDSDSDDSSDWVDDGMYPEDLVAFANAESPGAPECVQSYDAESDAAFYLVENPQNIITGETYLVPISDTEAFISIGIFGDDNAVVYINASNYDMSAANETAYDYTYLEDPSEFGGKPIDADSPEFTVAESCGV